jgi:hypothetical protein
MSVLAKTSPSQSPANGGRAAPYAVPRAGVAHARDRSAALRSSANPRGPQGSPVARSALDLGQQGSCSGRPAATAGSATARLTF